MDDGADTGATLLDEYYPAKSKSTRKVSTRGLFFYLFDFMLEDALDDSVSDDDDDEIDSVISAGGVGEDDPRNQPSSAWNPLNVALFITYTLSTAATVVPIAIVPTMSQHVFFRDENASAAFVPRTASYAVLGTAFGKFLNSAMGDVFGARRTSVLYSFLMALSLLALAASQTAEVALWSCFMVEFCQSVQWPCIIVILASHYRKQSHSRQPDHHHYRGGDSKRSASYEGGIYVTSLASRFGSLLGIPICSLLLKHSGQNWRLVSLFGAWLSLLASSVMYLFVQDAPGRTNQPENPIDYASVLSQYDFYSSSTRGNVHSHPSHYLFSNLLFILKATPRVLLSIFQTNLRPSLQHVLQSGTFWIVAFAHTGASTVRTSERILGTYFRDTSLDTISENQAGGLAVFSSLGTMLGIMIAGQMFMGTSVCNSKTDNGKKPEVHNPICQRQRKRLVARLYILTVGSCYALAFLAIPWFRYTLQAPPLILRLQILATFLMGFGIAVPFYHIPSLVGASFGCDKGMYAGYTDGVAYGLSALVWRIVGNSVQEDGQGAGWFYGWAAVAILLVLSSIVMLEFMEHYFVRPSQKRKGAYETIIFA